MAYHRGVTRTPVLDPTRYWECPSCDAQHITRVGGIVSPMHPCKALAGLSVPYVEHSDELNPQRVRHLPVERGDMIGDEVGVRHDADGTAMMAVRTERWDDTNDIAVFPGTATGTYDQRTGEIR